MGISRVPGASNVMVCLDFLNGACLNGDRCRYVHPRDFELDLLTETFSDEQEDGNDDKEQQAEQAEERASELKRASGEDLVVLGGARECLKLHGRWDGREQESLSFAVQRALNFKQKSCEGTVHQLCISPASGSRIPCDQVMRCCKSRMQARTCTCPCARMNVRACTRWYTSTSLQVVAKQSIVGDCQGKTGIQPIETASIKNAGSNYLDDAYLFIESLLSGVSLGDADLVREVVSGPKPRKVEQSAVHLSSYSQPWCTGDNVYLSGVDLSWENFHIGDLLVVGQGVVILNTGYPHQACWKYGVRCGTEAQEYANSTAGMHQRLRGFKGALLLRTTSGSAGTIKVRDRCFIVRRGTLQYQEVVQSCRAPLKQGAELRFNVGQHELRAAANDDDVHAYIDLLICAGCEAGRVDARKHRRPLPKIAQVELGIAAQYAKL